MKVHGLPLGPVPSVSPGPDTDGGTSTLATRIVLALGLGVAYAAFNQVAFVLLNPAGGAAFYPPAGLALAVLVLTPRRRWPWWIAAMALAETLMHLSRHRPPAAVLGYVVADMTEPVIGALLLVAAARRFRGRREQLISFAILSVALAPAISALIGATSKVVLAASTPARETWWYYFRNWWVSDALGVLVIGSLILAWARPTPFERHARLPAVAAVAALGAAAIVASGVLWQYPLVYIALPGLVWAAFVGGAPAVTAVGASSALAADWVAITGRSGRLLAASGPAEQLEMLQLFIGLTFLTGLFLAVEIAERRRIEQAALEADRRRAQAEEAVVMVASLERQSIAQDTHDIVGHGLTAMLLHVAAARRMTEDDPAGARELLEQAEAIGRRASGDLGVSLSLLGNGATRTSGQGLDQVPHLVRQLQSADVAIDLRVEGAPGELSTLVDWSAFRIVQEALTNVLKHAPGKHTTVTVRFDHPLLILEILNDGDHGDQPTSDDGRGLTGMRERAVAVGGSLDVGSGPGGFSVVATLPLLPRPDEPPSDPTL